MIRQPIAYRLNPSPQRSIRESLRQAAALGAKGVVLEASGDLSPRALSESGKRDLRHVLRTVELSLVALHLPTRRPFDSLDGLEDRLSRIAGAFRLAYDLGARVVLARVGPVPPDSEAERLSALRQALSEMGRMADHQGVRLAIETGTESGEVLRGLLDGLGHPGLAASVDPGALLRLGHDPVEAVVSLGPWVAHAYASEGTAGGTSQALIAPNPRGFGFRPGSLDWEAYLGSLEEVDYRGFLTIWPDPNGLQDSYFSAIRERLQKF
jgi:sugar phosphate isomerase/epimerase